MSKPEPLTKDKVCEFYLKTVNWLKNELGIYKNNIVEQVLLFKAVKVGDIESAVEWLLKELEKELCLEAPHCEGNNMPCEKCKAIVKTKDLIKQAFEGVLR